MTTCKCPTCGAPFHISADPPKKRRKRSAIFSSDTRQHFGQSVAPTFPQPRQQQQPSMAPGTTRDVEQRRPEMPIDIATKALNSIGFGVASACTSILSFAIWPGRVPWYTPFAVVLPAAGLAWFVVSLRPQDIVTFTERLTRIDLNNDGIIGKPEKPEPMTLISRVETMDGAQSIEIPTEITNVNGFLTLCRAVHYDGKNFSVAEASRHKVDEREMATLIARWAQESRLIDAASVGKGKTIAPTHGGKAMIKQYAKTPLLNT